MKNIKHKTVSSVFWSSIDRLSSQGLQFIFTIIVARVLIPSDYGLIAMLGIFLALADTLVNGGLSTALIQKKNRTKIDYSTVFYLNIILSVIIYFILFCLAPVIALFYQTPQLEIVAKIAGLNIIISAFGLVQRTRLTITLNFKLQAIISLTAVILSGILTLILAYKGWGVWALVIQSLSSNLISLILLWYLSKWKPLWVFSQKSFYSLSNFGYKVMISNILHVVYINLYSLVIGKKYSSSDAGLFNKAFSFSRILSFNITQIIIRAIYPIQCSIQDDNEKLTSSFITYLRTTCFIIFPLMVSICVLAKPLTIVLLTEKWLAMVPLLQVLSIAYMLLPIMEINKQILNVKGRSDFFLKAEILKKIVGFAILFGTLPFGMYALCWGLLFYNLSEILIIIYYTKKVIHTSFVLQLKELFPIILLAIVSGIGAYSITFLPVNNLCQLFIGLFVGGTIIALISKVAGFKEWNFVSNLIRNYIQSDETKK